MATIDLSRFPATTFSLHGHFIVKPNRISEAETLVRRIIHRSATEQGMITYQVSRDEKDPLKFLLFETWEGRDALGAHLQTEEFQEFINAGVVEGGLQMSVFRALEPLE